MGGRCDTKPCLPHGTSKLHCEHKPAAPDPESEEMKDSQQVGRGLTGKGVYEWEVVLKGRGIY